MERTKAVLQDAGALAWVGREDIFDYYLSSLDQEAKLQNLSADNRMQCQEKWVFVGQSFFVTKVGWAWGPSMHADMKYTINNFLKTLADDGSLNTMWSMWVNRGVPCYEQRNAQTDRTSFSDFACLYLIVIVVGVTLVLAKVVTDFTPYKGRYYTLKDSLKGILKRCLYGQGPYDDLKSPKDHVEHICCCCEIHTPDTESKSEHHPFTVFDMVKQLSEDVHKRKAIQSQQVPHQVNEMDNNVALSSNTVTSTAPPTGHIMYAGVTGAGLAAPSNAFLAPPVYGSG